MGAQLTVLQVAYPFAILKPGVAGGAEQVLQSLDRALVRRGHRSLVVAAEGSRTHGTLHPVPVPEGPLTDAQRSRVHGTFHETITRVLSRERVDLVHLHGVDFPAYLPERGSYGASAPDLPRGRGAPAEGGSGDPAFQPDAGPPLLATLHLPVRSYPRALFDARVPGLHLCCVSRTQRRTCPDARAPMHVVPNGVPLDAFVPRFQTGEHVVALGRICPEKGYHLAMDAARRAGLPFVLAGRVYPYETHVRYFDEEIRPRLGPGARFEGPVGPAARRQLLSRARCLVVPSLVDETSCLVAMEALASGTPVVAFDRGALREVVDHGRTGFLVDGPEALTSAMRAARVLDRAACRRVAEERFGDAAMHEGYLALYRRLIAAEAGWT